MIIRPAKIEELDKIRILNTRIMEVVNQASDDDLVPKIAETEAGKEYFTEAIKREDGIFLVAEVEGKLIGYVNGGPKDMFHRKSKYFEIENVGVVPDFRGQGIGKELMEQITELAKLGGFTKIYVMSYYRNAKAVGFYKSLGYKEIDISLEKSI